MDLNLEETFTKATNYVSSNTDSLTSEQLLCFYGYYKQANEGPCNIPKPGFFEFKNKQKWEAWNSLKDISKEVSMQKYIDLVAQIDPNWIEKPESSLGKKIGWVTVSRFADLSNDDQIREEDKTIFDIVKENQLEKLSSEKFDFNLKDENGMTPLIWASDRGFEDIICFLAKQNADLNSQDNDGQTALHYAVSCGHVNAVTCLLKYGADPNITDSDGLLPLDCADSQQMISILKENS